MSAPELARPWWHNLPWMAGMALVPAVMILQHWDPCDSTAAIASGNSVLHIALSLLIGFLVGLGVWCDRISSRTKREPAPRSASFTILTVVGTLLIGWLALATWQVSGHGNQRFAINGFWQWVSMLAWAASIGWMSTRPGFSRLVVISMIAIGVGIVVYGFWEYSVIQPELRRALQRDPEGLFRREGIAIDSSASLLLADRIRSTEMRSVYALANSLGGFLACFWVLILGGLFVRRSATAAARSNHIWIACHASILLAIAVALLLTKSRTAWLAAGAGTFGLAVVDVLKRGRLGKRMLGMSLAIGLAVLVSVLCIVAWFDPLILTEAGKSLAYRFDYWRGACELIAREPWFGFGVGNFQSTYLQVKVATAAESPADPHNFLLEAAHGGGIPFFLILVFGIGLSGYLALGSIKFDSRMLEEPEAHRPEATKGTQYLYWGVAIITAIGILTWSLFTSSDQGLIGILLAVVAAAATAIAASIWRPMTTSVQHIVQDASLLWSVFAVVLIHGLASGGWLLPGTMGMAMTALGLAMGTTDLRSNSEGQNRWLPCFSSGWLISGAGLLVVWYLTMALPLSQSVQVKGALMNPGGVNPAPPQIRDWLKADPHDPELARLGMEWTAERLTRSMGVEARSEWESLLREMQEAFLKRDPKHALASDACGQASTRAATSAVSDEAIRKWLEEADRAFEEAALLNPASVQAHMQAAVAAYWVGDFLRSQHHCTAAEAIDSATTHRDRKIEAAQVFWPVSLPVDGPGLPAESRLGISRDFVKAEPMLRYLRSQSQP
jgi:O-antigen ligase